MKTSKCEAQLMESHEVHHFPQLEPFYSAKQNKWSTVFFEWAALLSGGINVAPIRQSLLADGPPSSVFLVIRVKGGIWFSKRFVSCRLAVLAVKSSSRTANCLLRLFCTRSFALIQDSRKSLSRLEYPILEYWCTCAPHFDTLFPTSIWFCDCNKNFIVWKWIFKQQMRTWNTDENRSKCLLHRKRKVHENRKPWNYKICVKQKPWRFARDDSKWSTNSTYYLNVMTIGVISFSWNGGNINHEHRSSEDWMMWKLKKIMHAVKFKQWCSHSLEVRYLIISFQPLTR